MHIYVHVKTWLPNLSVAVKARMEDLIKRKLHLNREMEELETSFFISVYDKNFAIPQKKDELEEKNEEHLVVQLRPVATSWDQLEQSIIDLEKKIVQLWLQIKENRCKMRESVNSRELQEYQDENLIKKTPSSLKCLQINLKHKEEAWKKLVERLVATQSHIVFIQEPYLKLEPNSNYIHFPSPPEKYRIIHNLYLDKNFPSGSINYYGAIMLVHEDVNFKRVLPVIKKDYSYQELVAGIRLPDVNISLYSIYCRPSKSLALMLEPLQPPDGMSRTVFCMDANAVHPSWSFTTQKMSYISGRGEDLEFFHTNHELKVANKKNEKQGEDENEEEELEEQQWTDKLDQDNEDASTNATNRPTTNTTNATNKKKYNYIDVTLHGKGTQINDWKVLTNPEDDSFSDHRYISFSILVRYNIFYVVIHNLTHRLFKDTQLCFNTFNFYED